MIVCEDSETGQIWAHILRHKGLEVFLTDSPILALKRKTEELPDLVIIDETTPEFEGVKLVQEFRVESVFPIILFTPQSSETTILEAYHAGVDECITKPVSPAIFLAKVQAALRRARTMPIETLKASEAGGLRLDPVNRVVILHNRKSVKLSYLEFRLLHLLMQNPNWTFKSTDIIDRVWGFSGEGSTKLLKHLIFRLRQKIEVNPRSPKLIVSEHGIGYKFHAK